MSHDSKLRHTVFILKIWFAAKLLPPWLYGLLPWFAPLRFLPAALGISTFFEIEDQGTKLQSSVCRIIESKRPLRKILLKLRESIQITALGMNCPSSKQLMSTQYDQKPTV